MTAILDLLSRRQADWATLAKSDAGATGVFARDHAVLGKGDAIYSDSMASRDRVDDSTMTSWWTISSCESLDREGDVLIPKGCLETIKNYARNPVVSLDHFRDEKLPIGVSVGDRGLPLIIGETTIKAGLRHHDLTPASRDVYTLVRAGILRGASIGFLPLKAKQAGDVRKGSLNSPRFIFESFDVTEWAVTPQPISPEAVRIELSRGHIESEQFKKSLADFAQKPLQYAHGWTPEDNAMSTVKVRDIQSVRLAKAHYADADAARTWLKSMGFDDSVLVDRPNSHEFTQHEGECGSSVKLAKGVEAMLLKDKSASEGDKDGDKTMKVDDAPDEAQPVQKAADAKADAKPDEKKGPPRATHAVQFCGDLNNHVAGAKQYLTEGAGMLDHGPTVELAKKLATMHDEMKTLIDEHVGSHFDGIDLAKVSQDRIAAKEEEAAGKNKKTKALAEEDQAARAKAQAQETAMVELKSLLGQRAELLDGIAKSQESAAAHQGKLAKVLQLN